MSHSRMRRGGILILVSPFLSHLPQLTQNSFQDTFFLMSGTTPRSSLSTRHGRSRQRGSFKSPAPASPGEASRPASPSEVSRPASPGEVSQPPSQHSGSERGREQPQTGDVVFPASQAHQVVLDSQPEDDAGPPHAGEGSGASEPDVWTDDEVLSLNGEHYISFKYGEQPWSLHASSWISNFDADATLVGPSGSGGSRRAGTRPHGARADSHPYSRLKDSLSKMQSQDDIVYQAARRRYCTASQNISRYATILEDTSISREDRQAFTRLSRMEAEYEHSLRFLMDWEQIKMMVDRRPAV